MGDNNMRAFPSAISNAGNVPVKGFDGDTIDAGTTSHYPGMSLRDYFAAKAMQAMVANNWPIIAEDGDALAATAYKLADVMLAERAK